MSVRVRFAPSPTGALHVGGVRTALYNYLFARGLGGTFLLRIEDTDAARSTAQSVAAIYDSLHWLGLSWDEGPQAGGTHGPYFQSERRDLYRRHAEAMQAAGKAYLCYCTAEELEQRRQEQLARGEALSYDGRCRHLDDVARARLVAEGRTAAVRYALPEGAGAVGWEDVVREHVEFQSEVLDDFVVLRSDGLPTYNFACVVDDHAMEITHVIRGDDHISNTPRQILLYRALGWETPRFAHVPMILGADGSRLSKRHGATSVSAYRDLGYLPETMVNFLALLGWSFDGQREIFTLAELEQAFRLERVGSNPAIFNNEKLEWMNGQHLRALSEDDRVERVTRFLEGRGRSLAGHTPEWRAALVKAMGDRLKTLADAEIYGAFALDEKIEMDSAAWSELLAKPEVGPRLGRIAREIEADGEFSLASLERITRELCAKLGIKAGELIGVMRVALTGRTVSPGIFEVIWLLGKERAVARLDATAERWSEEKKSAPV